MNASSLPPRRASRTIARLDHGSTDETNTRLHGRALVLARVVWVAATVLTVASFAASLPHGFEYWSTVCTSGDCSPQLTPEGVRQLEKIGFSADFYAAYLLSLNIVFVSALCVISVLLAWRGSNGRMALFTATMLVTHGGVVAPTLDALVTAEPVWRWPVGFVHLVGGVSFYTFFFVFPDGRFVPRWTWTLAAMALAVQGASSFLPGAPDNWPLALQLSPFFGLLIPGLFAQVYRYRRISTLVERQQTKWVVFGMATAIVGFLGLLALFVILVPSLQEDPLVSLAGQTALYVCQLFIPLSLMAAILRYRLWDIDLVINRTLVYGSLTACIIGIYVLVVGYLGALFRTEGNLFISLVATGLVAVLFQPLRERLQRGVNRLTYGERDEPYAVISRLGERLEGTLAPEAVLPTIVQTIREALKLPYAAITFEEGEQSVVATESGSSTDDPLRLPLIYQGETVGELLLAPRAPGEGFAPADRRLLEDLARQAGVAARAVRLTADLQHSRERLVTTREEERRRLRRDLHDGLGPISAA